MACARIAVYKVQSGSSADEVMRRAERGLAPILAGQPGFLSYELVHAGNHTIVSISRWQSRAGADAAARCAASWVRDNLAPSVTLVSHYLGEVEVSRASRSDDASRGGPAPPPPPR